MSPLSEAAGCPRCAASLPPFAPAGLCPRCLMAAGLGTAGGESSDHESQASHSSAGHFVPPEPAALAPLFPQLEILELIGAGGMGAVYKARQPGLDRLVALKILPPERGADPAFAERFTREARALARLNHPHIVNIFDFGQVDGLCFFLMEYVEGTNLRQLVGRLSPEKALGVVAQLCEALQYAHDAGIVHRDIKPENVLMDGNGRIKIADFGLAKLLGEPKVGPSLTGTAQVMGTWRYMAPEQLHGSKAVDHRVDIYALGIVFYELLTGELPLGRFALPSQRVQVDVRLDEVVLRALESEPDRRYQRVRDLQEDTERIRTSNSSVQPDSAQPAKVADHGKAVAQPELVSSAARRLRRPLALLLAVACAQVIAAGLLAGWLSVIVVRIRSNPDAAETSTSAAAGGATQSVTRRPHTWRPYRPLLEGLLIGNLAAAAIGVLAVVGAVSGSRLESARLLRWSCGLMCLPSPTWPLSAAAAVATLSQLAHPQVKQAFAMADRADFDPDRQPPSLLASWNAWTYAGVLAGGLMASTALVPWSRISVFGLPGHVIGLDSWHGIAMVAIGGATTVIWVAWSVLSIRTAGRNAVAVIAGLAALGVAGAFFWQMSQPPTSSSSVSAEGNSSLVDSELVQGLEQWLLDAVRVQPHVGPYAAIVAGTLLAGVALGAGRKPEVQLEE